MMRIYPLHAFETAAPARIRRLKETDLKSVNVPADTGQDNEFFPDYLIRRDSFRFHSIPDRFLKINLETGGLTPINARFI